MFVPYEERRIYNPQLLDQMQIDKVKCMTSLRLILIENKEHHKRRKLNPFIKRILIENQL